MANKYRGYFFNNRTCGKYRLEIGSGSTIIDVDMGASPFIVSYDKNNLMFDELFPSTSSMEVIVSDDCTGGTIPFQDVLPNTPLDTPVILYSGDTNTILWSGFLNSNVLSQPYDSNKYSFSIEASDSVAVLQYLDYKLIGTTPRIATFKEIVDNIMEKVGITTLYFPRTRTINGTIQSLSSFTMSERNFFSSDIDEPWKCSEVMEEMCKYLGMTLCCWRNSWYFLDRAYIGNHNTVSYFRCIGDNVTTVSTSGLQSIGEESYRGGNSQISLAPLYNHLRVVDSYYDVDDFLPDWFNNDHLTNRYGELWDYHSMTVYNDARYPTYKGGSYHSGEDEENTNVYFRKLYDNDYYESHYYTTGMTEASLPVGTTASTAFTEYVGGTLTSLSTIKNGLRFTSRDGEDVPSSLSWENYLMISQLNRPSNADFNEVYNNWAQHSATTSYFKIEDFTSAWTDNEVFSLKSGYTNPFIFQANETFVALNITAIWERYYKYYTTTQRVYPERFAYINENWANEAIEGGNLGGSYVHLPPYLIFKFGIGNRWWNGSAWTSTETAFLIQMPESLNDDGEADGSDWNTDKTNPNRVRYSYNQKTSGYQITFDGDVDLNDEVYFTVCMPMKLSAWRNSNGTFTIDSPLELECGLNGYCWLSDFSCVASCQDMGNAQEYNDILNENEVDINEDAVNDLSDITFKFTTVPSEHRLSYSNVGLSTGGYLETLTETQIGVNQKPELNCIQRYVEQYSTQTTNLQLSLTDDFIPVKRFQDNWSGKYLVCIGAEYDFKNGTSIIELEEIK